MHKISPSLNKNLLEAMQEISIFVESPCGGRGLCGKCKVEIVDGDLPPPCTTETQLLTAKELENQTRLACLVYQKKMW